MKNRTILRIIRRFTSAFLAIYYSFFVLKFKVKGFNNKDTQRWAALERVPLIPDKFSVPADRTYVPAHGTYVPKDGIYIPAYGTEQISQ